VDKEIQECVLAAAAPVVCSSEGRRYKMFVRLVYPERNVSEKLSVRVFHQLSVDGPELIELGVGERVKKLFMIFLLHCVDYDAAMLQTVCLLDRGDEMRLDRFSPGAVKQLGVWKAAEVNG